MNEKRIVRFPLVLKRTDGDIKIRQIEEFKSIVINENDVETIVRYYESEKLDRWLRDHYEEKKADEIKKIELVTNESLSKIFEILGVNLNPSFHLPNIKTVKKNIKQRDKVKEVANGDKKILDNYFNVVFNQKQFDKIVSKKGVKEVYIVTDEICEIKYDCSKHIRGDKIKIITIGGKTVKIDVCLASIDEFDDSFEYEKRAIELVNYTQVFPSISDKKVGDTIEFGKCNRRPIEWTIMDLLPDGSARLMTKYALVLRPFDHDNKKTYIKSQLREWLNKDFLEFFTSTEQSKLISKDDDDKISILSRKEFEKYKSVFKDMTRKEIDSRLTVEWWLKDTYHSFDSYNSKVLNESILYYYVDKNSNWCSQPDPKNRKFVCPCIYYKP